MIEYRESLEEQGIKNPDEIERKVEIHRQCLQSEYGLLNFSEDTSKKGKALNLSVVDMSVYLFKIKSNRSTFSADKQQ